MARDYPLIKLVNQIYSNAADPLKGRQLPVLYSARDYGFYSLSGNVGSRFGHAVGWAMASAYKNDDNIALAYIGEGTTAEGDFHEALNVAAVWGLPIIFIIENNGYGLSTPVSEQYHCKDLVDKATGYGMEGIQIDGNNILSVYDTVKGVREYCIEQQKPYLIECMTFRMRGHSEASGLKYLPKEMFEKSIEKDPIKNYERFLVEEAILSNLEIAAIRSEIKTYIDSCPIELEGSSNHFFSDKTKISANEHEDVYAKPSEQPTLAELSERIQDATPASNNPEVQAERGVRFIDAIKEGLHQSMLAHPELILMGQDIAEYGGAFKITEGLASEFGKERVRNTPLCESAIVGTALGLSLEGFKSVVEMQFADFVTVGFNQITNNLAKIHYRWGQNADVVIRMPTGAGVGAGPFHSQSNEAWFVHTPGLKVVYPSTPEDAKGLLIAAINDPNPVMFFEHKALYRSLNAAFPEEYYEVEIGKARQVRLGDDVSIITYGMGVIWAEKYADEHPGISIHILDLRTLLPLDYKAIRNAVNRTGKVLVLHEDTLTGGIGGEVAAWIAQNCFEFLDAPVMRCASLDTPIPFNQELEKNFLAQSRLHETIQKLINY